jgi:hypothetical protein
LSNPTKVVFTLATANTDGSSLDPATVTGTKVQILDSSGNVGVTDNVAAGVSEYTLPKLAAGTYSVVLFTDAVSNGEAVESAASAPVSFTVAEPIPNPPSAVSVV